ncbi:MAG: hypothetical protein EOO51_07565 [Flavobacterium sp.]|nr:MAG: hypothetical protein EOO51_07565 [Flavobacterium sp.]
MDTQNKYSDPHERYHKDGTGEGNPGSIDPNEIDRDPPAKAIREQEILQRNESAFGINWSLKASQEHIDDGITQIDEETRQMLSAKSDKENDTDDQNRIDERDPDASSEDWDAEKNRSGRNK